MSLTADQITAPGTYAVHTPYGFNSPKRFRDSVDNIKKIASSDGCTADYDGDSKTWTVIIGDTSDGHEYAARRLADAITQYGAIVELLADDDQPEPAAAPSGDPPGADCSPAGNPPAPIPLPAQPLRCATCFEPIHRAVWECPECPGVQMYAHDTAAAAWACHGDHIRPAGAALSAAAQARWDAHTDAAGIDWGQHAVCVVCRAESPLAETTDIGTGSRRCADVTACSARALAAHTAAALDLLAPVDGMAGGA